MTTSLSFKLISPEKVLADMPAKAVQLPATEGDMGVLPEHAPVVTGLRDGLVTVIGVDGAELRFNVSGGFVEVTPTSVTLLADSATAA
ncbi:MAG: ATP synthase F1 subunit epsilon [Bdellovibrionales bacterium]